MEPDTSEREWPCLRQIRIPGARAGSSSGNILLGRQRQPGTKRKKRGGQVRASVGGIASCARAQLMATHHVRECAQHTEFLPCPRHARQTNGNVESRIQLRRVNPGVTQGGGAAIIAAVGANCHYLAETLSLSPTRPCDLSPFES